MCGVLLGRMNAECESVLQELKSSRAFAKCRPKDWEDLGRLVLALEKKIQSLVDGSDRRPESLAWDASLQEVVQIRTAEGSNSGIVCFLPICLGFVISGVVRPLFADLLPPPYHFSWDEIQCPLMHFVSC